MALILISLLVAPPASAGQKRPKPITWEEAEQLKAGTDILVAVTGFPPMMVTVLFVDSVTMVPREPSSMKLPGNIVRTIRAVGPKWPSVFEG